MTNSTEMRRWADAGFLPAVLPIIPPSGPMAPGSGVGEAGRGKVPGVYRNGVWTGFPGWTRVVADQDHVETWSGWERDYGAGVGLQARQYPGVDIDVPDETASEAIAGLAEFMLGPAPHRIGRAPKRLLPYRLADDAEPFAKRRVTFTVPGDANVHAVEILGDGQFYVVAGTHASTGQPYQWENGHPAEAGPGGLTPINAGAIDQFIDAIKSYVESAGGEIIGGGSGTGPSLDSGGGGASAAAHAIDPTVLESALKAMGNPFDYDEWIRLSAAIKAALNEDEQHYHIYEDWCLAYPGADPDQQRREARKKWDSFRPPYRLGGSYVLQEAANRGWQGYAAAVGFTAVPGVDPTFNPDDPEIVRDWVFVEDQARFFRPADRRLISEGAFIRRFVRSGYKLTGPNSAAGQFFANPRRRVVDRMTYVPGAAALLQVDGVPCANLWIEPRGADASRQRAATVTDADVQPFLDHWEYLAPDPMARKTFLDWFAFIIQHPGLKPNWALFLGGDQGIGKDMGIQPVIQAIGEANTSTVQSAELTSDYTSWVANKRLVLIEEMRNFDSKAVMNKLKMYVTAPPHMIPVNEKYLQRYETPNVAAFFFMSNFRNALSLEESDRRYFVYWSPAKPRPASYYDGLAAWMANGGAEEVIAWLYARKLLHFNAQGRAPDSPDKTLMQATSLGSFESAIVDLVEAGAPPFHRPIGSLAAFWNALSPEIKRLPGAGYQQLGGAIRMAGGGPVLSGDGTHIRVRVEATGEPVQHGQVRVWATGNAGFWGDMPKETLRREFRKGWVPGASDSDVFDDAPAPATGGAVPEFNTVLPFPSKQDG